jgi:predicted MPP superfamily phosphohydrolase
MSEEIAMSAYKKAKTADGKADANTASIAHFANEVTNARGASDTLEDRLDGFDAHLADIATQKADKTYVDNQIANVANGSPKGVYATVEDLQTAFPTGTTGIYVVTADGKWYYWNGSAWTAGGVYQATALETDKTLTVSDAAADAKVTGDKVGELKSAFNKYGVYNVKLNPNYQYPRTALPVVSGHEYSIRIMGVDGESGYSSIYVAQGQDSLTSDIKAGNLATFTPSGADTVYLVTRYLNATPSYPPTILFELADNTDKYSVIEIQKKIAEVDEINEAQQRTNSNINDLSRSISDQVNYNENLFDGIYANVIYSTSDGSSGASSTYVSSVNLIDVSASDVITFDDLPPTYKNCYILYYNSSKVYLSSHSFSGVTRTTKTAPANAAYFRFEFSFVNDTPYSSINRCTIYINEVMPSKEIEKGLTELVQTSASNLFSNQILFSTFAATCAYAAGSSYNAVVVASNLGITPGNTYTLYCGKIVDSAYDPLVRVYISYTDSTIARYDVTPTSPFVSFHVPSNKAISTQEIRLISNNASASVAGVCKAYDIFLALGTLDFKRYFTNGRDIPSYFYSNLLAKENTINELHDACGMNGDSLLFLTDTHYTSDYLDDGIYTSTTYNANHSIDLVKHVLGNTAVRMMVMGGDLMNEADGIINILHGCSKLYDLMGEYKYRVMAIAGNHEYYSDITDETAGRPSESALYGAFIKYNEERIIDKDDYNDYYFDNTVQKTRYFVISCGRDTELDNAQAEWFMEALMNTPANYRIIVLGHAFLIDDMTDFRQQHKNMMEALDAVTAKTTYTFNGNTYDYSSLNNVTVVCVITGHTHKDGYLASEGGTLCICTTCDSFAQQGGGITRSKGTVNEQAFDVFQFDYTNKKIYATRIGYGSDREFIYT